MKRLVMLALCALVGCAEGGETGAKLIDTSEELQRLRVVQRVFVCEETTEQVVIVPKAAIDGWVTTCQQNADGEGACQHETLLPFSWALGPDVNEDAMESIPCGSGHSNTEVTFTFLVVQ